MYKGGASRDLVEQLLKMPLETVPDLLDDATHNRFDREVEIAIEDDLGSDVSDLCSNLHYIAVLNAIIEYSNGTLDKRHTGLEPPRKLMKTHEELRGMLASAWRRKSYREIRNLGACLRFVLVICSLTTNCLIR